MVQIATFDTDIEEPDETPVEFVAGSQVATNSSMTPKRAPHSALQENRTCWQSQDLPTRGPCR
ncbi:hypothetical protein GGD55_002533 [Rhizobium giardinii]|uniref:Uncharacterized protein n=1 Tax=Rhizobium giardinii TaxID=56731 RepID=A0A7W8UAH1_9HYPH|nr:hypothetical protein [Rhizobium giardinii]